jgi:hypothetical protein
MTIQSNQSRFTCQLTGKVFNTREAAQQHEAEVAERRCRLAGRKLSPAELISPPQALPDTRTPAERSAWRVAHGWLTINTPKTPRALTSEEKLAEFDNVNYQATEARKMTTAEYRAKTRAEFLAKQMAKPVVDADRDKCKAYAERAYEQAAWGNAPAHVRDLAQLLVTIAQSGRLEDFSKYAAEYVSTVESIRAAAEVSLTLQRAQLDATAAVEKFTLDEPESKQPAPDPPKPEPAYLKWKQEQGEPNSEAQD